MLERWNVQISTGGVVDGGMSRVFSIEFLRYMSIRAEAILLYLGVISRGGSCFLMGRIIGSSLRTFVLKWLIWYVRVNLGSCVAARSTLQHNA